MYGRKGLLRWSRGVEFDVMMEREREREVVVVV